MATDSIHDASLCQPQTPHATVNPCTLCAPLGAVLAAVGVEGAMPLLHGAQGCATYIRRYLISHFREPVDVASSSFTEASAVLGGENDFARAVDNIREKYQPQIVAVGTTCLSETIGEDLRLMIDRYRSSRQVNLPIVHASTPSYRDGHVEGYHAMVASLVRTLSKEPLTDAASTHTEVDAPTRINVLPPIVSPADLRHLRETVASFDLPLTLLPDYSDPLDGPIHDHYQPLAPGGTKLSEIRAMATAVASIDLTLPGSANSAGDLLESKGVAKHRIGLPIGVEASDAFVRLLEQLSGRRAAPWLEHERGRLLDAYADGHKYVFGKRIGVYGDPELVAGVTMFLIEIGAQPVLCATGARNRALGAAIPHGENNTVEVLLEDADYGTIESHAKKLGLDLLVGSSKGYRMAKACHVPLLRLGFPIHDRIGASRILSVGYRGTLGLFDAIVNTLMQRTQDDSEIGYSYL